MMWVVRRMRVVRVVVVVFVVCVYVLLLRFDLRQSFKSLMGLNQLGGSVANLQRLCANQHQLSAYHHRPSSIIIDYLLPSIIYHLCHLSAMIYQSGAIRPLRGSNKAAMLAGESQVASSLMIVLVGSSSSRSTFPS